MTRAPVVGAALAIILATGIAGCSSASGKTPTSPTIHTENSRPSGAAKSGSGQNPAGTPAQGGNVPGGGG
jgi:hypothetical protein